MTNQLFEENCLKTMARMPDCFIDLTVTSPPYDKLRKYKGYDFEFEKIAKELFRVTKKGGVVVWVVGDSTKNGTESLTSFKQALYFKEIGFNVETMIYEKNSVASRGSIYLYEQAFEYMFVLSKGKMKTVNLIKDKKNKYAGKSTKPTETTKNGERKSRGLRIIKEFSKRPNIWKFGGGDKESSWHPATFPAKLAHDHILSWSNENDLIYDPMAGSGTTIKEAIKLKRNWIASEMSSEYCLKIKQDI